MEIFEEIFTPVDAKFYVLTVVRIGIAFILGGIIGFQRESLKRPAGLRTHILVCVGSALVMVLSEYYREHRGFVNVDPSRLGAQVISGIGFLGAGTILKEGAHVKGLTTAAGLWAVACIGLSVGAGFFSGAIIVTLIVSIGLEVLKKFENTTLKHRKMNSFIFVRIGDVQKTTAEIEDFFVGRGVIVRNINFLEKFAEGNELIRVDIKMPSALSKRNLIKNLKEIEGVFEVY